MLFVQAVMLLRSLSIVHNNCKLNNGILLINNCLFVEFLNPNGEQDAHRPYLFLVDVFV